MPGQDPTLVGGFRIEELISTTGDVQVFRARDEQVDRRVLLRVAGEASASVLLDDARRLAAVSHPGLVAVLGALRSETGAYAAVREIDALPLSESGRLSSKHAARVAIDIAGAVDALARGGLRAPIDPATVLVYSTHDGVRGLLDPLRALSPGVSSLAEADPDASAHELAGLLEQTVVEPDEHLRRAIDGVRSGLISTPAALAAALASVAAPPARARSRRTPIIAAAGFAFAVVVAIAIAIHERSNGSPPAAPTAQTPAGRIVARVPLGVIGNEEASSLAFVKSALWVSTTAGRLLRIDIATNQIVGNPIEIGKGHQLSGLAASGGKLYASDYEGWLFRVDPSTGRIAGRRHLGAVLTDVRAGRGVLWVISDEGARGILLRVDPHTLRRIGPPIIAVPRPSHIEVRGSNVWVVGGRSTAQVVRLATAAGGRRVANAGALVFTATFDRGGLWIPDPLNGTLSHLDAMRMTFTSEALRIGRSVTGVAATGSDIWVATTEQFGREGQVRLERFDSRSGRGAGSAVPIGKGLAYALRAARGSLWVMTQTAIVRLRPSEPRPSLQPPVRRGNASPRVLIPGPLAAAKWRTKAFVARFTFSTTAFTWLAIDETAVSVSLLATRERQAELDVSAPRQVFADDTRPRRVGSPAQLLAIFRMNPRLKVGAARHLVIGGRPALQFQLRVNHPVKHPDACGPRACTLLYPIPRGTNVLYEGDHTRMTLLRSNGRTIVISEGGPEPAALQLTASILRTIRFMA